METWQLQRRLHDPKWRSRVIPVPDGWIVRVQDRSPDPVAAGPVQNEARALARELGHGEGRQARASPATAEDLDALSLPLAALGIAVGDAPWWREPEPEPSDRGRRTVRIMVAPDGRATLAHSRHAEPCALSDGSYVVAIDGVPATVLPATVLIAYSAGYVLWPAGTDPEHRRMSWGTIAWREQGASVEPSEALASSGSLGEAPAIDR